jgi:hypothetical protein
LGICRGWIGREVWDPVIRSGRRRAVRGRIRPEFSLGFPGLRCRYVSETDSVRPRLSGELGWSCERRTIHGPGYLMRLLTPRMTLGLPRGAPRTYRCALTRMAFLRVGRRQRGSAAHQNTSVCLLGAWNPRKGTVTAVMRKQTLGFERSQSSRGTEIRFRRRRCRRAYAQVGGGRGPRGRGRSVTPQGAGTRSGSVSVRRWHLVRSGRQVRVPRHYCPIHLR